jgi:hopanoid biosynthesis associated RND transporter like protein HpnN
VKDTPAHAGGGASPEPAHMPSAPDSLVTRFLGWCSGLVYDHPRWFFYPQLLLLVGCVFYTVHNLKFVTSRNELVGSGQRYHEIFLEFRKEFPGQDDLIVIAESENREKNRQFVERLGARLETETNLFGDVFYKGDLKMMGPKALLFLPEETLRELHQTLREYRPFIELFSQVNSLNNLFRLVNQQFRSAARGGSGDQESLLQALPALERIVDQAADSLTRPGAPPSPGIYALFGADQEAEQRMYITFAGGRIYLVTARAVRRDLDARAVQRLRELVRETQNEVPGLNVGMTGEPVLEFDEMRQSQRDTAAAAVISLLLVAVIFIYGYRETGRPIKAVISLLFGLGYTMGYTTLVVGHLNILTITFAPILIGLAIDFGVHLVTRYEEEVRHDQSEREALRKAMVNTGRGIYTGAFTTAGAFFAMALADFKGVREMGIITGGGMLICLVPMMTLLPVLLAQGRQNVLDHQLPRAAERRARIERLWLERPGWVVVLTLVISGLAATQVSTVRFDYNLLNLQSKGLSAVEFEHKLIQSTPKSVLYAAVVTNSLDEALALESRLTNLNTVASVDSMARLLTEDQGRKLTEIGRIKRQLAGIRFADPDPGPVDLKDLSQTLTFLQSYLNLAAEETQNQGETGIHQQLQALREAIRHLQQRIWAGDGAGVSRQLAAFQHNLLDDIRETFVVLRNQDNRERLRAEDLPPPLRNRFIGQTGQFLLMVYPRENVWEREPQERFIRELRTIDHQVTGTPVQLYEYTTLLKKSYEEAALYALGAIVVLIFAHFRSVRSVLLALLPVGIGSLWMVGLMGLLGVPFNPANIMTLPLVIGVGVTNGIHILTRFAEEHSPRILARSTGKAVLVSGLTTVSGFGSLMLAKHQGIASLGFVMSVGTATCMVTAMTFLPSLLMLLQRGNKKTQ